MASEVYSLYIRILTPVHVGVDKSRDLIAGLDFTVQNGSLKIYDHKKLMEKVGMNQYCNALEKGKRGLSNLLKTQKINLQDILAQKYDISGDPGELKRQIRDGMKGHALLPGSSIKGALTSVLFSKLRSNQNNVNAVLGNFQYSLNRFIQCTDVSFQNLAAYNAKIFNLSGHNRDLSGGWKHGNNTSLKFEPTGFTFAYETIQPGYSAPFTLRFDKKMYNKYIEAANNNSKLESLPKDAQKFEHTTDFQTDLFSIISDYTDSYLDKEVEFFKKFDQAEHSEILQQSLQKIKDINTLEAPVFRLASGSGFHSITGDWQFETHDINDVKPVTTKWGKLLHQRGLYNKKDSAKSRRFAFEKINGDWQFHPMGFVQIMTKEYYKEHFERDEAALRQQEIKERKALKGEQQLKIKKQQKAEDEAKKPRWVNWSDLSTKKFLPIDAEVLNQEGNQMVVKPLVNDFSDNLKVRYPKGMPKGTIITIQVKIAGKNLQISGPPIEK